MSTRNLEELKQRIETRIATAMVPFYLQRYNALVSTRANDDAWQAFLKRVEVAESLSQPRRTTPAVRIGR